MFWKLFEGENEPGGTGRGGMGRGWTGREGSGRWTPCPSLSRPRRAAVYEGSALRPSTRGEWRQGYDGSTYWHEQEPKQPEPEQPGAGPRADAGADAAEAGHIEVGREVQYH